ncbi:MAG: 2-(1,2-epoxy-1,2-dihydrophenyl)acetyl-CoA isomerase PaaG [Pseudomonadota bacterium]
MTDDVLLQRTEQHVLHLTLNRPDRLNAFTPELHTALRAALDTARLENGVRAVLLTGAGRGFCAGQDLGARDLSEGTPDLGASLENYYNPLVRTLRALPMPVICAVNGVAAGAGANIALACDIVLAARSARFIQSFAKLGLIPDAGGSWSLPTLIGESRAKALCLTGDPLDAERAEQWGLVYQVFDDDSLMAEATQLAERLANGPTQGLSRTKDLLQRASVNTLDAQLDLERDTQRIAGASAEYAEGVTAFKEKRPPKFTAL